MRRARAEQLKTAVIQTARHLEL